MVFRRRARPGTSSGTDRAADPGPPAARLAAVLAYHERSKHGYGRFARSMGFLDWDTQPDPFRRYEGAELVRLERPRGAGAGPASGASGAVPSGSRLGVVTYEGLYHPGVVPPAPLDAASISSFLYHALALSAWKRFETSRWSLRVNPSSGNLHPTEGYLVLPALEGVSEAPVLSHYAPREHGLELRARLEPGDWSTLTEGLPTGAFLVGLSSIPWREAWKYGERAWRYCQHDVGHALGALRYGAALLGWRLAVLPDVPDARLAALLGLDRGEEFVPEEPEHPDLLAVVLTDPDALVAGTNETGDPGEVVGRREGAKSPGEDRPSHRSGASDLADLVRWSAPAAGEVSRRMAFSGRANTLSSGHVPWPVIDEVERATRKDDGAPSLSRVPPTPGDPMPLDSSPDVPPAARVLRQRRSAVAMDGRTGLTREGFFQMLSRVVPDRSARPWDALTWRPRVHLALFVHRVADVPPGLYVLARDADRVEALRAAMPKSQGWSRPEGCPPSLPLFLHEERDARALATGVSCGQEIAGDGAFAAGMLAEFEGPLQELGAPLYRHLYWETGVVGQTLYLEAEALGLRATGIGCFFDDPVHQAFGLQGRAFQSLYHFTVGGAVDDDRLTTEPAYPHDDG